MVMTTFMLKAKAELTRCLLKKLDHLPSFPMSDSQLGPASLFTHSQKTRPRGFIVL